jgi:hypothetical protein
MSWYNCVLYRVKIWIFYVRLECVFCMFLATNIFFLSLHMFFPCDLFCHRLYLCRDSLFRPGPVRIPSLEYCLLDHQFEQPVLG